MEDIQNQTDTRNIPLDRVGIKHLSYPIRVLDKFHQTQNTIAEIEMGVDLPRHSRGTHMSRFVEVLEEFDGEITSFTMGNILRAITGKLGADRAEMAVAFPYFLEKTAPVSRKKSRMRYDCRFWGMVAGDSEDFVLTVIVPVTTLCPCSKAISAASAHNQRTFVTVDLRFTDLVWIEDVVRLVEDSASAEVFALLKREDEKFLTEQAYARPRFTEDLVREVALQLEGIHAVSWYAVGGESLESIHAHSAFAFLKRDKKNDPRRSSEAKTPVGRPKPRRGQAGKQGRKTTL
jgi:GTP cyclohydrolase IB